MSDPLFSVSHKIALVTGGGTGIGRMIATALAQRGAKVYIVGRRAEKLHEVVKDSESYKGSIVALQGDVSNKDGILKVVAEFKTREKSLNILVNAAGILRIDPVKTHPDDSKSIKFRVLPQLTKLTQLLPLARTAKNLADSLLSAPWEDWQDSMGMNVSALYFLSVGCAPLLHQAYLDSPSSEDSPKETPVVINIGSIAGIHNARDAASVSYQTSKSAVIHLTKCLATRFLPLHTRVNCIAPGLFPSEMTNSDPKAIRNTHKTHFKAMPEGRAGAPEDIAGPVLFLASRAGAYVNGNTLDVSGGRTLVSRIT
ncbi:BQ2448_1033 [Microbotryum intermedium]|uniref:BQ2448_1033 protein n=1 Tax=Microbotryum intermedium TaxID=269621 RepID=A0A238F4K8_9BASI|nr:BQ2448_1033 [Microbotryum intermedium]